MAVVRDLLHGGARWTNRDGVDAAVRLEDIVIVAPTELLAGSEPAPDKK